MKRSIMVYVGILGLSQFLASAALATGDGSLCYSTGPVENENGGVVFAQEAVVKVLNNSSSNSVTARILVSGLTEGVKINIFDDSLSLIPQSSGLRIVDVVSRPDNGSIFQYEIQVKLTGAASSALLGSFARIPTDNQFDPFEQVASQRLVHSEWTEIPCSEFGPIP